MVAGVLAAVGVTGATTTYFVARDRHSADRADILAWERAVEPALVDARAALARSLPGGGGSPGARAAYSTVRAALSTLEVTRTPDILRAVADGFLAALRAAMDAVAGHDPSSGADARTRFADARTRFADARARLVALRCRALIPDCGYIAGYPAT